MKHYQVEAYPHYYVPKEQTRERLGIIVSVTDEAGDYVTGLREDNFRVWSVWGGEQDVFDGGPETTADGIYAMTAHPPLGFPGQGSFVVIVRVRTFGKTKGKKKKPGKTVVTGEGRALLTIIYHDNQKAFVR